MSRATALLEKLAAAGQSPNGGLTAAEATNELGCSAYSILNSLSEKGFAVKTEHERPSSCSMKRRRLAPIWEITELGMKVLLEVPVVLDSDETDDFTTSEDLDRIHDLLDTENEELFSQEDDDNLPQGTALSFGNIALRASAAMQCINTDDPETALEHLRAIIAETKLRG